jgi:hypothetical protein
MRGSLTPQVSARRSRRCLRRSFPPSLTYHSRKSEHSSSVNSQSACGDQKLTRGHHVVQHRAVLSAVQGSARCAAHAHVRAWPSGLDGASAPLAGGPLRDGHSCVCVLRLLQRFVCQESPARCVHRIKGLNVREGSAVRTRRPIDRHHPRFTVVARDEPAADPSVLGRGAATGARRQRPALHASLRPASALITRGIEPRCPSAPSIQHESSRLAFKRMRPWTCSIV